VVRFDGNTAEYRGAISAEDSINILISENSDVTFTNNCATRAMGAISESRGPYFTSSDFKYHLKRKFTCKV